MKLRLLICHMRLNILCLVFTLMDETAKIKNMRQIILHCLLFSLFLPTSLYAETFVYQEKDGTRWITDKRIQSKDFTFIGKYGRPTATLSCKGVTPAMMNRRADKYMHLVRKYAEPFNIDPILIKAIIRAESCFDRRAISRAGARGLMQLMPATARSYGVLDRFNAESNIKAGITHFNDLLIEFKGSKSKSIAAYNAGSTAVKRYKGIPPYKETQKYVKRVLNFYQQYASNNEKTGTTPLVVQKLSPEP